MMTLSLGRHTPSPFSLLVQLALRALELSEKNFVRVALFRVMPTNPPETFMEWSLCLSALSAPAAQSGT